jgi:hypothetical protein
MILLVTPSERASGCAAALHKATSEDVVVAGSLARATTFLRTESYIAVVLDQHLLETEPQEAETVLEHLGTAIPVQVNLAISGMERLVREVRAAGSRKRLRVRRRWAGCTANWMARSLRCCCRANWRSKALVFQQRQPKSLRQSMNW